MLNPLEPAFLFIEKKTPDILGRPITSYSFIAATCSFTSSMFFILLSQHF